MNTLIMKMQNFHTGHIRQVYVIDRLCDLKISDLNTTLTYGLMDNLYPCLKHTLSLSVFSTKSLVILVKFCAKPTFSMNAFNLLLREWFLHKMFTLSLWKKVKKYIFFRVIRIDLIITWR